MCNRLGMTDEPALDLIGTSEAADILEVAISTITRWGASGILPMAGRLSGQVGALVFRRVDVEALAAARQIQAAGRQAAAS
jgi:predicted site-specific integrase-resolvase